MCQLNQHGGGEIGRDDNDDDDDNDDGGCRIEQVDENVS